jgi:hypothetical protein
MTDLSARIDALHVHNARVRGLYSLGTLERVSKLISILIWFAYVGTSGSYLVSMKHDGYNILAGFNPLILTGSSGLLPTP